MMIRILLLLVVLGSPIYGQESNTENNSFPYAKYFNLGNISVDASLFTRLEGIDSTTFLTTTGVEWMVGSKAYYYGQLRFSYQIIDNRTIPKAELPLKVGLIHGAGGYLFDMRSAETKRGLSMVMNGGVGLDVSLPSDYRIVVPGLIYLPQLLSLIPILDIILEKI